MATTSGEAMQSLQAHMDDMRSLTLCKICLRPFYEPFILGCGHSFCYSCLRSWFGGPNERRKNRNCPDCRTEVKAEPAPNYLLREISHLFLSRAELLPEDETVAEHQKDQDEEAKLLSKDKKEEGLFQGVFKSIDFEPFMAPIHDLEDHVERCPVCTYEIEDGRCLRCGLTFDDGSDLSEDESDLSGLSDLDDETDSESDDDGSVGDEALPYPHFHAIDIEDDDGEDEDDSDINEYDRHDDFIDNEDELDVDFMGVHGDYENPPTDAPTPYSEDSSDPDIQFENHMRRRAARVVHDSDEESISTNPEPYAFTRGDRRAIVIDDDEDEDGDSRSPQAPGQFSSEAEVDTRPFMMPDLDEEHSNSESSENESSSDDGKSSSDSESQDSDPDADSDSDSSDATIEHNAADEDNHVGEDSDDTVIPPQSKRTRQNRLQEHRDRRSYSGNTNNNMARGRLRISRVGSSTSNHRRGRLTSVH